MIWSRGPNCTDNSNSIFLQTLVSSYEDAVLLLELSSPSAFWHASDCRWACFGFFQFCSSSLVQSDQTRFFNESSELWEVTEKSCTPCWEQWLASKRMCAFLLGAVAPVLLLPFTPPSFILSEMHTRSQLSVKQTLHSGWVKSAADYHHIEEDQDLECLSSSCSSSTEITHPANTSSGVHRCAGVPIRSVRDVNLQTISNAARTRKPVSVFLLEWFFSVPDF